MSPDQACGAITGLLIGDALGVPYEFTRPEAMPPKELIEYEPPPKFHKAWPKVPPGTWSDDGAQALCVLDAILHGGKDEHLQDAVGTRLVDWYKVGFMAVEGIVFDIGNTTKEALHRVMAGVPPTKSGALGERTKANGSLMRTLPVAFMQGTDDEIVRAAMGQSHVTHAEVEPMMCCAIYCLWARFMAEEIYTAKQSWNLAFEALFKVLPKGILWATALHIQNWQGTPGGTGYCIDSLHSVKQALEIGTDFESTIKHAVAFGHDTDTTAAIAGGLAGIRYEIPKKWLEGLRGQDLLSPILSDLRTHMAAYS